jgi:hypothetical protein
MILIHVPAWWLGFLSFPIIALAALSFAGFGFRQLRALKTWYIGIPALQWWAMGLVVIGIKILRKKEFCRFMPYDGRYWVSPTVKGFEIPDKD